MAKSKTQSKQSDIMQTDVAEIAQKPDRMPAGALDTLFIEYYLETASPKHAYKGACKAADKDFPAKYAMQYGKAMFDRLKERINDALVSADIADKALGRKVMRELAVNAQSESVKGQMASTLSKGLYPDVQVHVEEDSLEDIMAKREALERQLTTH